MLIYQFIKTFLDNKMSIFEEYGSFKISEIIHLFILLLLLLFFFFFLLLLLNYPLKMGRA